MPPATNWFTTSMAAAEGRRSAAGGGAARGGTAAEGGEEPREQRRRAGEKGGSDVRRREGARGRSAGPAAVVAVPRETIGAHREEETWEDAQRKHPDLHGFYTDPAADLANARAVFIAGVSVALVLGSAFLHYLPDGGLQQWSRREAERLIRDRELRGLPLLDPNYYDPKRLDLPPPRD